MHRYTLLLSPRAKQDLSDIWQYSLETWGKAQAEHYLQGIEATFVKLLDFPHLGRKRAELLPACYSLPVRRHVIFYSLADNVVQILGVLHQHMDVSEHLLY